MKPFFLILLLLLFAMRSHAQVDVNVMGPQTLELGGLSAKGYTTDFDNTPYIPQSGWQSGYIKAQSGKIFKIDSLRFNMYQNIVEYRFQQQTFTPTFEVSEFGFADGRVYANGFRAFDGLNEQTYFEVLYRNKTYLLRHERVRLLDITAYNSASRMKHFDFNDYYYLLQSNGKFTRSRRLNSSLLANTTHHEKKTKEYVEANQLNLKNPEGWKSLLVYYDTL